MIKGVSKYAVEIASTNSPFFEKVICFVRPQYAHGNALDLHREAARLVSNLSAGVEESPQGSQHVLRVGSAERRPAPPSVPERSGQGGDRGGAVGRWLPLVLSAGGGAAVAVLLTAIF